MSVGVETVDRWYLPLRGYRFFVAQRTASAAIGTCVVALSAVAAYASFHRPSLGLRLAVVASCLALLLSLVITQWLWRRAIREWMLKREVESWRVEMRRRLLSRVRASKGQMEWRAGSWADADSGARLSVTSIQTMVAFTSLTAQSDRPLSVAEHLAWSGQGASGHRRPLNQFEYRSVPSSVALDRAAMHVLTSSGRAAHEEWGWAAV